MIVPEQIGLFEANIAKYLQEQAKHDQMIDRITTSEVEDPFSGSQVIDALDLNEVKAAPRGTASSKPIQRLIKPPDMLVVLPLFLEKRAAGGRMRVLAALCWNNMEEGRVLDLGMTD